MNIFQEENINKAKDKIYKGKRLLPSLDEAIFAKIKGYVNGSYPSPLEGKSLDIGYYPLSEATPDEMKQIKAIKEAVIEGMK
jgi:hypothetical protein